MNNRTHGHQQQAHSRSARKNKAERVINRKALLQKREAQTLGIQPALKVGASNDKYEQEADKVAEHVVNSSGPAMSGAVSPGGNGTAQRGVDRTEGRTKEIDWDDKNNILAKRIESPTDEVTNDGDETASMKPLPISRMTDSSGDDEGMKMHDDGMEYSAGNPVASELGQRMADEDMTDIQEKPLAQRNADNPEEYANMQPIQRECKTCEADAQRQVQPRNRAKAPGAAFTASNQVSRNVKAMKSSGGTPLPASERAYLEPRFGRDLSHVKIHTDDRAAKTSQAIQAKAFTVGNNIAFNKGYYKPGTHEGRKLLAHEITHTIQQTGGSKKGTGVKAKGVSRVQREVMQRKPDEGQRQRNILINQVRDTLKVSLHVYEKALAEAQKQKATEIKQEQAYKTMFGDLILAFVLPRIGATVFKGLNSIKPSSSSLAHRIALTLQANETAIMATSALLIRKGYKDSVAAIDSIDIKSITPMKAEGTILDKFLTYNWMAHIKMIHSMMMTANTGWDKPSGAGGYTNEELTVLLGQFTPSEEQFNAYKDSILGVIKKFESVTEPLENILGGPAAMNQQVRPFYIMVDNIKIPALLRRRFLNFYPTTSQTTGSFQFESFIDPKYLFIAEERARRIGIQGDTPTVSHEGIYVPSDKRKEYYLKIENEKLRQGGIPIEKRA